MINNKIFNIVELNFTLNNCKKEIEYFYKRTGEMPILISVVIIREIK
jgi:hypothetical protein